MVAKANEAVDAVRRADTRTRPERKRSRYAWLESKANLTVMHREQLAWLNRPSMRLKIARATRWRDDFNSVYDPSTLAYAKTYLRRWCYGAKRFSSRSDPGGRRGRRGALGGIDAWQRSRLSNGLLEATNSLINASRRRARGCHSKTNMITIIYVIADKLALPQTHTI